MSEENESLIGFDPLAWMKEEGEASPAQSPEPEPKPAAEAAVEPPPAEPAAVVAEAVEEPSDEVAAASEEGVIDLGELLDIAHVGGLYERLSEALRTGREPLLDATRLERVDAAGLQLLAAYGRELASNGGSPRWKGEPAAALRDAAALLDVGETLGLAA